MTSQSTQNAIAGSLGGLAATVLTHPIDMMKTRIQVQHAFQVDKSRPLYKNSWEAFRHILKNESIFAFYQGLTPNILGNTISWGLYFYLYALCKEYLQERNQGRPLTSGSHLVASEFAGIITSTLTNPIWVCKNRMQVQTHHSSKKYSTFIGTLRSIYVEEGIVGLWKGYIPGLFSTIHGAIKFITYEKLKNSLIVIRNKNQKLPPPNSNSETHHQHVMNTTLTPQEAFMAGSISKIIAATSTYPFQVIRSRIQTSQMGVQHIFEFNGFLDLISKTWKHEGIVGFYRGFFLYVVRTTPHAAITFAVYEMTMRALNK